MADPIALWHAEHRYFGRLLNLLRKQVEVFHSGGQPNYELMLDIISYLRDYTDKVHHPREDVAFARLAGHRPDLEVVLERLKQEHRVIANAGEKLRELLQGVVDGTLAARADIEAAAATYLVYYDHHIAKEEADILSRAEFCLTNEDWEEVARAVPALHDPLSDAGAGRHFRELRRQLALAA